MKWKSQTSSKIATLAIMALLLPTIATAFDSGSSDTDGIFNPLVDTELVLPADGIFNFTTVTIPSGVTVTFAKNTLNTPVTILASGDITIEGTINLNGSNAADVGASGDGNVGDDGLPGLGGPGGYSGGSGGLVPSLAGGHGLGLGGGQAGRQKWDPWRPSGARCGGAGGGFGGNGANANDNRYCGSVTLGGGSYGTVTLLPLIGGSGGGGGFGGTAFPGSGGGGGGAIIIVSSATITINGTVQAKGGRGGNTSGTLGVNGSGGGGSGGALRIIATTIAGNGVITATGGGKGASYLYGLGGNGAVGRIRLEADTFLRTSATTPGYSFSSPGDIFVAGLPTLLISRVAGVNAPAIPTGSADIVLPETTPNPVTVEFASSGVPVGNTVELTLTPPYGAVTKVVSNALAGTESVAVASVSIDLPDGPSILSASVSFTVTEQQASALSIYTEGEQVATVSVNAEPGKGSITTFTTVSGKQYTMPSNVAAM